MQGTRDSNRTSFKAAAELDGLTLLTAELTTHRYPAHYHDAFVIAVTEGGGACFSSRGQDGEVEPNRLLVFNPDEPHSGHMGRSSLWRYRGFYLAEPAIADLSRSLDIPAPRYFLDNAVDDGELISLFGQLHHCLTESDDPALNAYLLHEAFGTLFARHAEGGRRPAPVPQDTRLAECARRLLRDRFRESLRLGELADELGLTPYQFTRLFRRHFQIGPRDYLLNLRIAATIAAIERGMTAAEEAVDAGFYDQPAFNLYFKRFFGITPTQYLAASGAGTSPA